MGRPAHPGGPGLGDPSASPAYAAPLLARLRTDPPSGRVEIPLTRGHWETVSVAAAIPLARGWERQLDRHRDRLFYGPRLDPTAYRRWLAANAVSEVALPDAPMDPAGRAEAELVARRPAFLRPVWHDAHWRLFRVRGATPVASPGARARLAPDGVAVTTARPGRVLLRLRWTPYWRLAGGEGCVVPRRGWTGPRRARTPAATSSPRGSPWPASCGAARSAPGRRRDLCRSGRAGPAERRRGALRPGAHGAS